MSLYSGGLRRHGAMCIPDDDDEEEGDPHERKFGPYTQDPMRSQAFLNRRDETAIAGRLSGLVQNTQASKSVDEVDGFDNLKKSM